MEEIRLDNYRGRIGQLHTQVDWGWGNVANAMRRGRGLRAGELLVTGSFSGFFEVEPEVPVTAEFEGFGVAQATFASR